MIRSISAGVGSVVLLGVLAFAQTGTRNASTGRPAADPRDWPVYGGDQAGTRYSALAQVNRTNVNRLEVAWQFDPMDMPEASAGRGTMQTTPMVIAGVVYAITPGGNLVALNGATGKPLWSFHSNSAGQRSRGLTYWTDGKEKRILAGFGRYVYAIDAATGRQIKPFGRDGRIDLHLDLGRDPESNTVILSTPGVIYRDTYIVGGRTSESLPTFPGDIRAYDARTGQLKWSFHTIPRPGEYGYETWPKDAWTYIGSANNWAGMVVDEGRGIVFVPTGSPAADFYGGNRLGDGLFGNTLLALDAETGKRLWHFQAVKHDTWDRDFSSPPVLVTVRRGDRSIDAVAQPTKQGFLYVFDRVTGEPLFPIEYRKVPPAVIPEDVAAETQPFVLKPAPFARTLLTENMLSRRTPEVHAWAVEQFKTFRSEGEFVPLSVGKETVIMPGFDGGAEYGGSAFDPASGNIYVNANDLGVDHEPARTSLERQRRASDVRDSLCVVSRRQAGGRTGGAFAAQPRHPSHSGAGRWGDSQWRRHDAAVCVAGGRARGAGSVLDDRARGGGGLCRHSEVCHHRPQALAGPRRLSRGGASVGHPERHQPQYGRVFVEGAAG